MRWAIALVVVAACGRLSFEPVGSAGDGGIGDSSVGGTRCAVPARPDVSSPRVTIACDAIVATQEILMGGVVRVDCPKINFGSPILVNKDTVIDGHGAIFDGQGITRLFFVNANAHLTLLDLTVTHAFANESGAGIRLDSGGLVAFDSSFIENHGPMSGALVGGGAIAAVPNVATIEIYGGRFSTNTSSNAGAIQVYANATIMNASFDNNSATGSGGNVSGNGGDGGALQIVGPANMELCGDTFTSNFAGNNGGAITRIAQNTNTVDRITDVAIDFNRSNAGAGGAYVQGSKLTMRRVSATSNVGNNGAGLWLEGLANLDAENLSLVFNRADNGTGAGLFIGASTGGRLAFSTIADNAGNCAGCVQSAIANAGALTLVGNVIVDNVAPTSPVACSQTATSGGANFQWPGDLPLCVQGATVTDPFLQPRAMLTGAAGTYLVRRPSAGSPVIGTMTGCPADDILGNPRPSTCSAGSVEP